jgi:hypothetical protein
MTSEGPTSSSRARPNNGQTDDQQDIRPRKRAPRPSAEAPPTDGGDGAHDRPRKRAARRRPGPQMAEPRDAIGNPFDLARSALQRLLTAGRGGSPQSTVPVVVDSDPTASQVTTGDLFAQLSEAIVKNIVHRHPELKFEGEDSDSSLIAACRRALDVLGGTLAMRHGSIDTAIRLSAGVPIDAAISPDQLVKLFLSEFDSSYQAFSDAGPEDPSIAVPVLDWYDWDVIEDAAQPLLQLADISECAERAQQTDTQQPSDRWLGAYSHRLVQLHYRAIYCDLLEHLVCFEREYGRREFTGKILEATDPAVKNLDTAVKEARRRLPTGGSDTEVAFNRPDIADLTSGEFYEIKPVRSAVEGIKQLRRVYVYPYNWAAAPQGLPVATEGVTFKTPTVGLYRSKARTKFVYASLDCPGLILYRVKDVEDGEAEARIARMLAGLAATKAYLDLKKMSFGERTWNGQDAANDDVEVEEEAKRKKAARIIADIGVEILNAVLIVGKAIVKVAVPILLAIIAVIVTALFGYD